MNKRELIKIHLSKLSLVKLLRYRLLLCCGVSNEDIELDISDLFKYPARLETSYFDNWQKDVLKSLFRKLEGEIESPNQMDEAIGVLLLKHLFSEKDLRTISLFDDFIASLQSKKVVLMHAPLQRKLHKLTF